MIFPDCLFRRLELRKKLPGIACLKQIKLQSSGKVNENRIEFSKHTVLTARTLASCQSRLKTK